MAETRERILQAALEVFAERGYGAATIRSIADRAGVRDITIFRHFGSKENLLSEIQKEKSVAPRALEILRQAPDRPVSEVLHELGRRYYAQMLSRGNFVRFLVIESGSNPQLMEQVSEVPRVIEKELVDYLKHRMQTGEVRRGDPSVMAQAFLGFFFSAVVGKGMLANDEDRSPDQTADAFVDLFLNGILARSSHIDNQ